MLVLRPTETEYDLKRAVLVSLGAHFVLLLVLVVRATFFSSEPVDLGPAIRVDLVGLPDKIAELPPEVTEPAPAPAKPALPSKPPPPAVKPEAPKVNLQARKRVQESAVKQLDALSKIESLVKSEKRPAPAPIKGNQVVPGTALTGLAKVQDGNYNQQLRDHMRRHWQLPEWLLARNLKASAIVFVDGNGFVVNKRLEASSGNREFDERVINAIEQASPFPAPPANLASKYSVDGVRLRFPQD